MTAPAPRDMPDSHTSAVGSMYRPGLDAAIAAMLDIGGLSGSATASTYDFPRLVERTAAGPAGQIDHVAAESTAEAVLEIRRRSGLTYEELSDLFDVSRRSVHHWASGKAVSARHDQAIRRILAAIRRLDQGNQADTRAQLLAVDAGMGVSALDLFKTGRFDEAMVRAAGVRPHEARRVPLSREAQDARRSQVPTLLLEAEQERPNIPAKARTVRAKRTRNTGG